MDSSDSSKRHLRLGLIINPYAGVGGPTALKGSDADEIQAAAAGGQMALTAPARAATFLQGLASLKDQLTWVTAAGAMGADTCREAGVDFTLISYTPASPSSCKDTAAAAAELVDHKVDLLVFVGGDGTARDVCQVVGERQLVLGVPAGVKMHSGVYAVNPQAATEVVRQMAAGELVAVDDREVRDIDEAALQKGRVKSRYFGTMQVPDEAHYIQQVKQGGREVEELVLADIAADIAENLDPDTLYIFGPGSTMQQLLNNLGWPATLLGLDAFRGEQQVLSDPGGAELEKCLAAHPGAVQLYITAIGGQGHIIGRGNQQLTPQVLRRVGRDNLRVVATRTKLKALQGRPLLMDSGDPALDREWRGFVPVQTGYRDRVLYPLGQWMT